MKLRIWSEYLGYEAAMQPRVLALLRAGQLNPIFAVHHEADLDALARLVVAVQQEGLEVGVWPLLSDALGYWPCEQNDDAYFERVHEVLDALSCANAVPDLVAVDLEPPFEQVESWRKFWTSPLVVWRGLRRNLDRARFRESVQRFERGRQRLQSSFPGVKTLAITLPLAAHDLDVKGENLSLWQDVLEAPWSDVAWDYKGIMAYGSMVAGYSGGMISVHDARVIHARLAARLLRGVGRGCAHVSLGITGTGKLGDEPVYEDLGELERDLGVMRAVGVSDVGIFCLEGLLARDDAEHWVRRFVQVQEEVPGDLRMRTYVMRIFAQGVRLGLGMLRR